MWKIKQIIKSPDERILPVLNPVPVYPEKLAVKGMLLESVVMVERRLRSPTEMKRLSDIDLGPFKYGYQLIPVIHFLVLVQFYRCAGDYHTVVLHSLYLIPGGIELIQMIY